MGNATELSRKSLRRDQLLELHFSVWPEPPPEMLKLPGVAKWWNEMKLVTRQVPLAAIAPAGPVMTYVPPPTARPLPGSQPPLPDIVIVDPSGLFARAVPSEWYRTVCGLSGSPRNS